MAADQERADRIRQLKQEHPETTWQRIADHVGVTMRAAQSWQEKGGIEYDNAKKLAQLWDEDLDYIWRGRRAGETPDLLAASDGTQLDRIERKLDQLLEMDERLRGVEEAVGALSDVLLAPPASAQRETGSTREPARRRQSR